MWCMRINNNIHNPNNTENVRDEKEKEKWSEKAKQGSNMIRLGIKRLRSCVTEI